MQVAGACYLIASFAALFAPTLAGESSLCLWLLQKGVDVAKWKAQLSLAG